MAGKGNETEAGEVSTIARPLRGPLRLAVFWIGVVTALTHIYLNTFCTMSELRFAAIHFGLFGLLCALLYPLYPARTRPALPGDGGLAVRRRGRLL